MPYLTLLDQHDAYNYHGDILGMRQYTKDPTKYVVDDNYTNRIVLGYPITQEDKYTELKESDGLMDFQKEDVLRMINTRGFLNANKMGTGKTIETVMACRNLNARSILIICPKAVIGQWVAKFAEWWPERAKDVCVYAFGMEILRGKIYVTNYDKLVSKKADGVFTRFIWDVLALDEAHYIKNRTAQRTKQCKKIAARYKYALTGTPILRNPDDLYSILEFLNPMYVGNSYWNFVYYYCQVVDGYFGREVKGLTTIDRKVERLNKLLSAVSCRRTNKDIARGKQAIHVPLIMDTVQNRLYNKVKKLLLDELPKELTIPNGAVLLTRLLQTTSAPGIVDPTSRVGPGIKFEYILEMVQNNPDEKFVVYSRFAEVAKALKAYLSTKEIECQTYTGTLNELQREQVKQEFLRNPNCRVIAGTIGALGTGVDGLQDSSHICVFIDRDFSPEINEQCEDRLHRMGQQQPVLCYYLECNGTVDHKVDRVTFKRAEDIRRALND